MRECFKYSLIYLAVCTQCAVREIRHVVYAPRVYFFPFRKRCNFLYPYVWLTQKIISNYFCQFSQKKSNLQIIFRKLLGSFQIYIISLRPNDIIMMFLILNMLLVFVSLFLYIVLPIALVACLILLILKNRSKH